MFSSTLFLIIWSGLYFTIEGAVVSFDTSYSNWRKIFAEDIYVRIPYYIDVNRYGAGNLCPAVIEQAIANMNRDLLGCIQFGPRVIYPQTFTRDFMWFSPSRFDGKVSLTCESSPGRQAPKAAGNPVAQSVIIKGSTVDGTGCCEQPRFVMAHLAALLGLQSEFKRPTSPTSSIADAVILNSKIFPSLQNLVPQIYAPFTKPVGVFNPTAVDAAGRPLPFSLANSAITPIDYKSITMVSTKGWSATGADIWTLPAGETVGTLAQLSLRDCQAIAVKYGCVAAGAVCGNPYNQ